jgi:hypothetical protein
MTKEDLVPYRFDTRTPMCTVGGSKMENVMDVFLTTTGVVLIIYVVDALITISVPEGAGTARRR